MRKASSAPIKRADEKHATKTMSWSGLTCAKGLDSTRGFPFSAKPHFRVKWSSETELKPEVLRLWFRWMGGIPRPELCRWPWFRHAKASWTPLNRKTIFLDAINKEILFGMHVLWVFLVVISGFWWSFAVMGYGNSACIVLWCLIDSKQLERKL